MGTLGEIDAQDYLAHLAQLKLPADYLRVIPGMYTAQAMVTTDLENNQITTFHAGAMLQAHVNHVSQTQNVTLGIVSPDGGDAMRQHVEQFAAANIPFIFDPGQGLPLFQGAELKRMIELATYVTVNDYEAELLSNKTGWSIAQIVERVKALIITRGEHGVLIHHDGSTTTIPAVPVEQVIDPTGCGDAFRGGLLYGLEHGLDWATTGRLANLMGSIKIAHQVMAAAYSHFLEKCMDKMIRVTATALLASTFALQGCALQSSSADVYTANQARREHTVRLGTIASIRLVKIQADNGQPSGLGAFGGGALGAIAGSAIGGGRGALLTGIVGGLGGTVAGHVVEGEFALRSGLEITVRLDNGEVRAITQEATQEIFRAGERVRLVSGNGITRVTH
ncbi:hypothetical protein BGZ96_003885 [Linnemannia gamsii]|uniref:Carbohydrate kinase PfkB domain-containing protein n=1 Tax=Linnemannia gamsii TaxID=64522 RepID=A0ABQ7K849_9FUNG|nr:hypothetical protein BGZ96_003885 [Linnemannia gamsii]